VTAEQQVASLNQGAAILGEVLAPTGFAFVNVAHGNGSGGPSAHGRFVRQTQSIDLHFRWSLGMVTYRWDDVELGHMDYLRAMSVSGAYPGFSEDPLDGFRHLAADLEGPLAGFVSGDRASFDLAVEAAQGTERRRLP
jgi:hypothetical protein